MVYFVCGGCGESFKRKQADLHTYKCFNWSFSCLDCNKEFPGMSYASHTQCISESEKYFGAHHVAKTSKDKNAVWIEKVRDHIASVAIEPRYSRLVERMLQYQSIPRKQQKFENFLKTSMNVTHRETAKELWKLVSGAETAKTETAVSTVDNKENNGSTETASSTVDRKESNGLTKDDNANGSVMENGHDTLEDQPAHASKTDKKKKKLGTSTEEMEINENDSKDSLTINGVESEKIKKSKKRKTTEDEEENPCIVNRGSKDKNAVWMKKLRDHFTSTTIKPYYSRLINRMLKYPKIPRKQEKFENFLKMSMNIAHKETVKELWKLVSGATTATTITAASTVDKDNGDLTEDNVSVNGDVTENRKKKKSEKKKNSGIVENDSDDLAAINGVESEKKNKSKKRKTTDDEEENNSQEEEEPKLTKSAKRRKHKHIQSATEEPDVLDPFKTSTMVDEQEKDFGDLEDISVGTVIAKDNFKWKYNIKKLIKEGPAEGIKLKTLLNKIEQLHNDELIGSAHSLPKDTLHAIMMKMLAKKPFTIDNNMAKIGKKK